MPRAALNTREVEEQRETQGHRTGPREVSAFRPAQRSIAPQRANAPQQVFRDQEDNVSQDQPLTRDGHPDRRYKGQRDLEDDTSSQPVTKSGHPDRRYKGQRDLPPPPEVETSRARTGGTVGDIHITIDGKPDRRFKENRSLSDEEVTRQWLEAMNEKFGRQR